MEKKNQNHQEKEKNNEINEKIEKIKENITEKTNDIKKDLKEDIEDIKDDLKEKVKEIKKEVKEKSKELKEDLTNLTEDIKEKTEEIINNVKDHSKKFDKKDIKENKAMACLCYIIAPVPYFTEYKSKWVRYHAIQGMNLFVVTVLLTLSVSIICSVLLFNFPILKAILKAALYAFMIIYAIIGIINVCNEEAKELPIINKFKFIKK